MQSDDTAGRMAKMNLRVSVAIIAIMFVAVPTFAQTMVRVTTDQAAIWQPGFRSLATVVKKGAELHVVARRGDWYEVMLPAPAGTQQTGMIAVNQVEEMRGDLPASPLQPRAPSVRPAAVKPYIGEPTISVRGLGLLVGQEFTARETFKDVFGRPFQPLWGGGVQFAQSDGAYLEVDVSRFKKEGQRVFRSSTGEVFPLGIPLTAALTPIEITVGYRFGARDEARFLPYVGAGAGYYLYSETCTGNATLCQAVDADVSAHKFGFVANGGVEIRVHRWIGIGVDAKYTHLPGILGAGGVSGLAEVKESDLGGIAGQFKVIIGR